MNIQLALGSVKERNRSFRTVLNDKQSDGQHLHTRPINDHIMHIDTANRANLRLRVHFANNGIILLPWF